MAEPVGSLYYTVTADTSALIGQTRVVERETEKMARSFNAITVAIKILAAATALVKAAQMADALRLLQARVNVAAESIEAGAAAMASLRRISTETRSSLEGNVQIFTRLNSSLKQLGGTQEDTLRITELLSKAITVSGASAQEKTSAMIQFGQALGSGKLAGDELRSLLENAPYLMKQLADGLGVPIGALKKLGEQGKLTSDVVVNALGKASDSINRDFAKFPQTLAGAFTVASDALKRLNEKIDTFTNKSAVLTGIVNGVGKAIGTLADMFDSAAKSADDLGRNQEIEGWARTTATVLSYVADAADVTWQTLSVLGRNVAFVFNGVKSEIVGIGAQIKAVASGDFAGAGSIGAAMKAEAAEARRALDEADAKTLADRKLWGQQMRDVMEESSAGPARGKASAGPGSTLKAKADPDEQRKLAAKRAAAQAYYEGLVADSKIGLAKIGAEEQKALADNTRRRNEDKNNADIYNKARNEIVAKYARERLLLEEQTAQEIAALTIATTLDQTAKIEAIRAESIRSADAQARLGVISFAEAERKKMLAVFVSEQAIADIRERNMRAQSDAFLAITLDETARINEVRAEGIRQAEEGYQRGKLTFLEAEAAKTRAAADAEASRRALEQRRQGVAVETAQIKAGTGGGEEQVALIRAQAEAALAANDEARRRDIENIQLYADRELAIRTKLAQDVAAARVAADSAALQSASQAFGSLADITKTFAGEQSGIYRAMFAVSKAFAIADAIVKIQQGIANALNQPYPLNIAAAASTAAAAASIVSNIQGTQFGGGRQYGGPTDAGKLYRVNETGRPEMFTAANGSQYMLPTKSGNVTPADQVGGGSRSAAPNISNVFNITVPAGTSAETADQLAARLARRIAAASSRNN